MHRITGRSCWDPSPPTTSPPARSVLLSQKGFFMFLKKLLFILCLTTLSLATKAGTWTGSGGSGHALLFTQMGEQLLRTFVDEKYEANTYQVRDLIDLPLFAEAIMTTKVVAVSEPLFDRFGHPATALYLTLDEWHEHSDKFEAESEFVKANNFNAVIIVDITRFEKEYALGPEIAMGTVFHEYLRATHIDDDNYKVAAKIYDRGFFGALLKSNQELSKHLAEEKKRLSKMEYKLDLVDSELGKTVEILQSDEQKLEDALIYRRPFVKEKKKAIRDVSNSFANMVGSTSMTGFGRAYAGRILKAQGSVVAEQFEASYKMSELEVADDRVSFYTHALTGTREYFLKLREARRKIILDELAN